MRPRFMWQELSRALSIAHTYHVLPQNQEVQEVLCHRPGIAQLGLLEAPFLTSVLLNAQAFALTPHFATSAVRENLQLVIALTPYFATSALG